PAGVEAPPLRSVANPRPGVAANVSGLATIGSNPAADRPALGGRPVGPRPMTLAEAQKRRREVIALLGGFAAFSMAVFLLVGGATLYLQLLADVLLVGYVGLLAYSQRLARERR